MDEIQSLFDSLFLNKTVALVGPAQYMMSHEFGEEIDQCDTVVRINRSYESVSKFSKNIGNRTDVLYSCLIEKPANAGFLDVNILLDHGIKLVCAPPASDLKGQSQTTRFHDLVNLDTVEQISRKIPIRIVDHVFHSELSSNVDCRPNTGFMSIYDILRFSPKCLKIFGFSFYLDGFIEGVKDGIQQEQNLTPEQFSVQCFNSSRHVQKNMWKFAKETLPRDSRIVLDPVLSRILNLERLDKDLFNKMD